MHRVVLLSLAAITAAGCDREEHWYAYALDELDVSFTESVHIDARITVPAAAWPQQEAVFDQSVRIGMDDGSAVRFVGAVADDLSLDSDYSLSVPGEGNVNVLAPFSGCDQQSDCTRTFRFEFICQQAACTDIVIADAYISIMPEPAQLQLPYGEELQLELSVVTP